MWSDYDSKRCGNCGKAIEQRARGRDKRFCCGRCRQIYWAHHSEELNKKAYYDFVCQECGIGFQGYGNAHRKYCSRNCYYQGKKGTKVQRKPQNEERPVEAIVEGQTPRKKAAKRWQEEAMCQRENRVECEEPPAAEEETIPIPKPAKALRAEALRLWESGEGCQEVSRFLGLSHNTVKSWARRYGRSVTALQGRRSRKLTGACQIKTMEEWSADLSLKAQDFHCAEGETLTNGRPVIFVCGVMAGNKGADVLSTMIEHKMRMDPFSGENYAFCGGSRDRIKIIRWDGEGFQVISRRKEYGTYNWPPTRLGPTVTVSAREFEYILRGQKRR